MNTTTKKGRGRPRLLSFEIQPGGRRVWRLGRDEVEVTIHRLDEGGASVTFGSTVYVCRSLFGYPEPGRWRFEEHRQARPVEEKPPSRLDMVRADLQAAGLSDDVLREFDEHARKHPNAGHAFARSALGHTPQPPPKPVEGRPKPLYWHPLKEAALNRLMVRLPRMLWPIEPYNFGYDELDQWTGSGEEWPISNAGQAERDLADAKAFLTARGQSWEYEDPDARRDDDEDEAPPPASPSAPNPTSILNEIEAYEV